MRGFARIVLFVWLAIVTSSALAANAAERKFIRDGMSEGEVLLKIGKPDSASEDTGGGAKITEKRWIYLPASGDDRTMTTLVSAMGRSQR